ncbi:hypothetical protein D0C36_21580 [Mucilaginibacter conchicola]|uniref:Universal stress protein n=1 Tax=Mucilaginibacter conchicola TaxID=2303333 RepID=A0A372NN48_9SPHI|nr:hypothetical protein [Mucilaginibacter conchicola]RFZ90386.1 hypothetical protein D0C36_21580 [Mucilaginibacter conchicola]
MKTILIPTDYQASSLDCVPAICSRFKDEELNLIFVHVFKLSDSLTDVLMLSRRSREYEQVSDEFFNRMEALRKQYTQINNVKIEFLYGSTLNMFKTFIEANEVDAVIELEDSGFNPIHRSSIDPTLLVKRSGLPVISTNNRTYARIKQPDAEPVHEPQEELTEM